MKTFLKILGIVAVSLYIIVSFISFVPNPAEWGDGGRAAFILITLIISGVSTAISES